MASRCDGRRRCDTGARVWASIALRFSEVTMKRGLAPLARCSALPITRRRRFQLSRVAWKKSLNRRAGRGVDVRAPQFCRQQLTAAEHIERQITVTVKIAVEEPAFLVAV